MGKNRVELKPEKGIEFEITPDTRLGTLLKTHPELESVLVELSPEFKRLRNPVLRRTIARVATLRQIAKTGNVPLAKLINVLRQAAGDEKEFNELEKNMSTSKIPEWFELGKIARSLDLRPIIEGGGHPIEQVVQGAKQLKAGEILELVTPFVPAPLLDLIQKQGYRVWHRTEETGVVKSYIIPE